MCILILVKFGVSISGLRIFWFYWNMKGSARLLTCEFMCDAEVILGIVWNYEDLLKKENRM